MGPFGCRLTRRAGAARLPNVTARAKRWAAAAVVAAAAGASITVALASGGKLLQPVGDRGRWHLVFDDEFGGSSLNTSRWSPSRMNSTGLTAGFSSSELECFDPRQVSVTGGHLQTRVWLPGHHAITDCSPSPDGPSAPRTVTVSATSSQKGVASLFRGDDRVLAA